MTCLFLVKHVLLMNIFNQHYGEAVTDWINLILNWSKCDPILHTVGLLWDSLSVSFPLQLAVG